MNFPGTLARIVVASAAAACSGGGRADGTAGTTGFDGEVPRLAPPREGGGTERFVSARDEPFGWPWRPFLPNHAGRRWAFVQSRTEGTALPYALVSWDDDDPADDPAAGDWLWVPGADSRRLSLSAAEPDLFVDGPEIGSADLAGMGRLRHRHLCRRGGRGVRLPPRRRPERRRRAGIRGGVRRADRDHRRYLEQQRVRPYRAHRRSRDPPAASLHAVEAPRRAAQPAARPTDYEIRFGGTPIGADGSFANMAATVGRPGRAVAGSSGSWSGSFSNRPDADGNPRFVADTAEAAFGEADGSEGSFRGIFIGVGTPPLPPAARR